MKPRHADCLSRLSRIEGQVRGVARMVEEERYCIDILTQLRAIRAAITRVEGEILKDHADHCVANAMSGGDLKEKRKKVAELIDLVARYK
ncbi:MAG: metal-sensitive transcriptional regulator [Pseudomonadota bacterium]|nr:metal-sensitive transcriptional regulator [Pseudomonadota bacterium]